MVRSCGAAASFQALVDAVHVKLIRHFRAKATEFKVAPAVSQALVDDWAARSQQMSADVKPKMCAEGLPQLQQAWPAVVNDVDRLTKEWGTFRDLAIVLER